MAAERGSARTFALVVADLFEAAGRLRRAGDAIARSQGQSQARWQVLSVVSNGRWTVPRIAERLGVTRQNVQRIADELVVDVLARYEDNERHARSPFVLPTAAGLRVLGTITAAAEDFDAWCADALGAADLDRVHDALERLLGRLRANDQRRS